MTAAETSMTAIASGMWSSRSPETRWLTASTTMTTAAAKMMAPSIMPEKFSTFSWP